MPFSGGEAIQMTHQGGYVAFESRDGQTLYYTKGPDPEPRQLFAIPAAGGPKRLMIPGELVTRAFYPVENGISYMGLGGRRGANALKFHGLVSGRSQVLTTIDGWLGLGLAISRDRSTVLFSLAEKAGADLILIDNYR